VAVRYLPARVEAATSTQFNLDKNKPRPSGADSPNGFDADGLPDRGPN